MKSLSLKENIFKKCNSSIRYKLMGLFLAIALIPLIVINALGFVFFKSSTSNMIQNSQDTVINENVNFVNSWVNNKLNTLQNELKSQPELRSADKKAIVPILNVMKSSDRDIDNSILTDKDGNSITETGRSIYIGDRDYFVQTKATKKPVISDVVISRATGNKVISITVPILDEAGNFNGMLASVVNIKALDDTLKYIKIGDTGYGYLISDEGTILTYNNADIVGGNYSKAIKDQNLASYIKDNVLVNSRSTGIYNDSNGNQIMISYAKVPSSGWKIVTEVPVKEVYKTYNKTFDISVILFLIVIGIIILISTIISKTFTNPIGMILGAMRKVADSDLTVTLDMKSKDEIGQLAHNFNDMVAQQKKVILNVISSSEVVSNSSEEISSAIEELSFTTKSQANTVEEFTASIEEMDSGIQDVTGNISKLASNVSGVSTTIAEMSKSIQETSNNVEEAAAAINEVSASIEQMGESIQGIADQSKLAQQEAGVTVAKAEEGNMAVGNTINEMDRISEAVGNLSTAIKELGSSAERVGEIVNVIDDIAEQTNLLSLNAAIEAARAGDAGKGFAVVANSIRGLAERSGEATKDITKLIKGIQNEVKNAVEITKDSTDRVKEGVQYVKGTGEVFEQIFEAINKTSNFIDDISNLISQQEQGSKEIIRATEKMADLVNQLSSTIAEQAAGSDDIVQAVSSINDLTQQISATTQQQSASSQEVVKLIQGISRGTGEISAGSEEIASTTGQLAGRAQDLLNLVNSFKVDISEDDTKIQTQKLNCWEYKKCGREVNGAKAGELGVCPAASLEKADGFSGGTNGGRSCAYITGTFCGGSIQGTYKDKAKACEECDFYKALKKEEGSKFNVFEFTKYTNK